MPSRNCIKIYVENGFYHVYNRGVEKRTIFEDQQDYTIFLRYLEEILSPPNPDCMNTIFTIRGLSYKAVKKPLKNYSKEVDLCAYCLMPNHFHLLIKQKNPRSVEGFMRALTTRYSMYFNKRYDRVGSLFQGRYKASYVNTEIYLLHLSRYIHNNPLEITKDLVYTYSSYGQYLGKNSVPWIKSNEILQFFNQSNILDFKKTNSYRDFVENQTIDSMGILGEITLE